MHARNKCRFLINARSVNSVLHNKHMVSFELHGHGTISTWKIVMTCNGNKDEILHSQYQASGHGTSWKDLKASICNAVQCSST